MSGWAHVLHAMYKPWGAGTAMYALQHGSLFVTTFVFLMGLLFKVNGVSSTAPVYSALSAIMLLLCTVFLVCWIVVVLAAIAKRSPVLSASIRRLCRVFGTRQDVETLPQGSKRRFRASDAHSAVPVPVSGSLDASSSASSAAASAVASQRPLSSVRMIANPMLVPVAQRKASVKTADSLPEVHVVDANAVGMASAGGKV